MLFALCAKCKRMMEITRKEEKEASSALEIPNSPGIAAFTQPACAICLYKLFLVGHHLTTAPISEAQSGLNDSLPPEVLTGFPAGYKNGLQKYLQPVHPIALN